LALGTGSSGVASPRAARRHSATVAPATMSQTRARMATSIVMGSVRAGRFGRVGARSHRPRRPTHGRAETGGWKIEHPIARRWP
jgi:hypothetical protein